ncbi:protein kinase domain-containing protein [Singulisphaera sp. PoT]|uniref:serine/threonine protein kinase n=1 Tax=Singulisphaera sp. PoT TaxID=3411797 RepID=UPI003BF4D440
MNSRSQLDSPAAGSMTAFMQIDAACDRFEAECRMGQSPDLAPYLAGVPEEARDSLFRNLLSLDCEYRRLRGEDLDPQRYRDQFPGRQDVIDSVFLALSERPICDDFPHLKGKDSSLDKADPNAETELVWPGADGPGTWGGLSSADFEDLKSVGYEVRRLLGWGGMGVVYEARQISLNRPVAIKLIRSGSFASDAELSRFQREAEAVAQLDHPHIVPVYEVGCHRGRHFFSMKLVVGSGLDRRLEEFADKPKATAKLVATVAEAIHHAHQRGILHRDLKPANILLDEKDEPLVTDFGLAKWIDGDPELTHSNALIGTPAYMAPEQTARGRGAVSTATDVYGLGTVLYVLLTGRAPFHGTTLIETLDMVRTQDPEPPSKLNPRVPHDLDVICRKCLEKEPNQRYASALSLSEDLSRWVRGEPILARPVGPLVRARMWAGRNPALAATASLAALIFVVGFATVTWKWREALAATQVSEAERAKAAAVVELLTQKLLARADTEINLHGRNPTVRDLLDTTSATLGGWLDGQPDVEAQVRETIGGAYLSLEQFAKSEEQLRKAIQLDARENPPVGRTGLRATNLLATLLDQTARSDKGEAALRANLADCRRILGPDAPITLDGAERLSTILVHRGKLDEAETLLRQNVKDRGRVFKPEHPQTLHSVYLLSRVLRERQKFGEAKDLAYRFAHDVQCAMGANHPDRIFALTNQGDVARDSGQAKAAENFYRQAVDESRRILGPDHQATRAAEVKLGQIDES